MNIEALLSDLNFSRLISTWVESGEGLRVSPVAEESAAGLWVGPAEDNLRRQPSWKRWYRPGTVCFCLRAFCLLRTAPFPLTPTPHPPFPSLPTLLLFSSPLPSSFISIAFLLLCHANGLICEREKTSEVGEKKKGDGEGDTHTHARTHQRASPAPPLLPLVILPGSFE